MMMMMFSHELTSPKSCLWSQNRLYRRFFSTGENKQVRNSPHGSTIPALTGNSTDELRYTIPYTCVKANATLFYSLRTKTHRYVLHDNHSQLYESLPLSYEKPPVIVVREPIRNSALRKPSHTFCTKTGQTPHCSTNTFHCQYGCTKAYPILFHSCHSYHNLQLTRVAVV